MAVFPTFKSMSPLSPILTFSYTIPLLIASLPSSTIALFRFGGYYLGSLIQIVGDLTITRGKYFSLQRVRTFLASSSTLILPSQTTFPSLTYVVCLALIAETRTAVGESSFLPGYPHQVHSRSLSAKLPYKPYNLDRNPFSLRTYSSLDAVHLSGTFQWQFHQSTLFALTMSDATKCPLQGPQKPHGPKKKLRLYRLRLPNGPKALGTISLLCCFLGQLQGSKTSNYGSILRR